MEKNMSTKKLIQLFLLTVIVLASFAGAKPVFAWGGCSGSYYVQWGDTLSGLAARCGTTVAAIRAIIETTASVIIAP